MSIDASTVVFYSLSRKFVQEKKAPPQAQEVIYYSLAIGHHLGVIDCLEAKLSCPFAGFRRWVGQLPAGSDARHKLEGIERFGEICIDSSHTHLLATALSKAIPRMLPEQQDWSQRLIALLQSIENEPAVYLMVRRHHD
ncbi:formate hydrogenlyase maturation HycH family protein [Serratia sp. UGAL515B_01]|uniref:formate hydrogenlyase maturation HycH family protein n=1 Tax=Serratia sp. UGAL515B_01 TaxID=2986763 RepID=UPI002955A774|nr:formate hydrogenlyase maturation HycH family protein [Serratia sp. UGAL515B_01]WON78639.1 formate hydrogenlyase maturation HycH family protein [Serratia sp. UGAL515B_01]